MPPRHPKQLFEVGATIVSVSGRGYEIGRRRGTRWLEGTGYGGDGMDRRHHERHDEQKPEGNAASHLDR